MQGVEDSFGVDGTDSGSATDEDVEGVHVSAVKNPLNTAQHAELLLRFPDNVSSYSATIARQRYRAVRQFVLACT